MSTGSGLLAVKRAVQAYLVNLPSDVTVAIGWAARNRLAVDGKPSGGGNRIVLIPGRADDLAAGPPKRVLAGTIDRNAPQQFLGDDPRLRTLVWWHSPITVCVWGSDPTRPADEEAQIAATEALFELAVQALHNGVDPISKQYTGLANIEEWGDVAWTQPPGEQGFGRELTFWLAITMPLFDQPIGIAFPSGQVARNPPG